MSFETRVLINVFPANSPSVSTCTHLPDQREQGKGCPLCDAKNWKLEQVAGEGDGTPLRSLAWKIPWTEEPTRLQSMGSRRVGHD